MQYVSLDKYPNQRFTLIEGSVVITFYLQYFRGITFLTVTDSDGREIETSKKVGDRIWFFPAWYERIIGANYRFEDDALSSPEYTNFNGTCVLVRYDEDDARAIRKSNGVIA